MFLKLSSFPRMVWCMKKFLDLKLMLLEREREKNRMNQIGSKDSSRSENLVD